MYTYSNRNIQWVQRFGFDYFTLFSSSKLALGDGDGNYGNYGNGFAEKEGPELWEKKTQLEDRRRDERGEMTKEDTFWGRV